MIKVPVCTRKYYLAMILFLVAIAGSDCLADNNYVMRFEFPFGIGDFPTTVTHGTRVRSLNSIESFVHEKRHIEAVVTWPSELKLCNLTEYRIGKSDSLRLPFQLRTQNDIWYHLIEFEVADSAAVGKYEITCAVDSLDGQTLQKPFYIVDKDYARTHIHLKSFILPCDDEGRDMPKQQANTLIVKDPSSRFLRTFFVTEDDHESEKGAFTLENSGELPVLLDVQYSIHDPANDSMVSWLDNLRQESGLDDKDISIRVFVPPHSSTSSILKIHSRENRLVSGTYRQRLRVTMCSSDTPVLEMSRPLYIRELNFTNTAATGFSLIVAMAGIVAIDNLSLEIEEGTICGILGPNGAGKSTTIRILSTLTKPSGGVAMIGGYDVMKDPVKAKKMIGVVHQTLNIDPELTPCEHLMVHGMLFGMDRSVISKRTDELLDFVGLDEQKDLPAGKFSGGMKRRLTIARALVHDPRVIIMDEPTVGLDAHARRKLWALMRELREKGHTILLTTHYIDEAHALSDRIVIIDKGKCITDGTPVSLMNTVKKVVADIVHEGDNHTHFFDTRQEAAAFIAGEQTNGTIREANLEDVFVKLTGRKVA